MALNLYKVRVYGALILCPFIAVLSFFIVLNFYGFLWSLTGLFVGVAVSVVVGKLLIRNAFSDMLEGKGVLALNIDSTGIIRPFIVAVKSPYIVNDKMGVNDIFDRAAVMQLATAQQARLPLQNIDGGKVRIALDKSAMIKLKEIKADGILELNKNEYKVLKHDKNKIVLELTPEALEDLRSKTEENITLLELDEDEYNKGRFALFHYPCLIYNAQTKSMLTKDFLGEQEKEAFAEHGVLYLNRKMQELTSVVRDFGRYVVELTKPKGALLGKWWVWAIIILFVVILVAMFAPAIIGAIKGVSGNVGATFSEAAASVPTESITPR